MTLTGGEFNDVAFVRIVPRAVVNDYDGDGKSDLAVFCQNTGNWYVLSLDGRVLFWELDWGWPGALPVPGDYDGDGKSDFAVFCQNSGSWFILSSGRSKVLAWDVEWGGPGAVPVSGDYSGDGRSDLAVFCQNSGTWYIITLDGDLIAWELDWGWPGAVPVSGDFSGDGRSDLAVFCQNSGMWYIITLDGDLIAWELDWGWPGAVPVSGDYNGDGRSDLAVFCRDSGMWYIITLDGDLIAWELDWGWPGALPVPGDYNGDGKIDFAVFCQNSGSWFILSSDRSKVLAWGVEWGGPGAWPVTEGSSLPDIDAAKSYINVVSILFKNHDVERNEHNRFQLKYELKDDNHDITCRQPWQEPEIYELLDKEKKLKGWDIVVRCGRKSSAPPFASWFDLVGKERERTIPGPALEGLLGHNELYHWASFYLKDRWTGDRHEIVLAQYKSHYWLLSGVSKDWKSDKKVKLSHWQHEYYFASEKEKKTDLFWLVFR